MKTSRVLYFLLHQLSLTAFVSAQEAVPVWCNSTEPPGDSSNVLLACPSLTQYLLTEIGHAMNDYIYQKGILAQTNRSCLPYPDYTSWWGTKFYGYFGGNSTYFSLRAGSNVNDDIWNDDGFLTSRRKKRRLPAVCSCDPNCKAPKPKTRCFFLFCGKCGRRRLRKDESNDHDTFSSDRDRDFFERETLGDVLDTSHSEEDEQGDTSDILSQPHNMKKRSFANLKQSPLRRRELQIQTIAQFAQARLRDLAVTGNITNANCLWFLRNANCFS